MEAHVRLQTRVSDHADFYIVVQGSRLAHVITAKRANDGLSLCFTIPGMSTTLALTLSSLPALIFLNDFLYIPQATTLRKLFLLHPTFTLRTKSNLVRGKRPLSTSGMMPRK